MVRQLFTRQRIEDLDLFEKHTNTLISHIGRHDHANNLTQLFYCYTLDIATEFLFGQTVGSMNEPQSEFAEAIAEVQRVQSKFARAGYVDARCSVLSIKLTHHFATVHSSHSFRAEASTMA